MRVIWKSVITSENIINIMETILHVSKVVYSGFLKASNFEGTSVLLSSLCYLLFKVVVLVRTFLGWLWVGLCI